MQAPRRIVGIDTGVNGSIALFLPDSPVLTMPNGIIDTPTVGDGKHRKLNYVAIRDELYRMKPDVVLIEAATTRQGKRFNKDTGEEEQVALGSASIAKYVGSMYALEAIAACLGYSSQIVQPGVWKRKFNLKGGTPGKEQARLRAIQLFPQLEPFMRRKKDHQRAEALLIAAYGAGISVPRLEMEEASHDDRGRRSSGGECHRADEPGLDIPD
jgi:hypothetical protein